MPTYSFTRTRERMRDLVLRKLGVLGVGETASADDAALVYEAFDLRLKELHALRILWWQVAGAATELTLIAGTNPFEIVIEEEDFLFPVTLTLNVGTEEMPVEIIGHRAYHAIPDKSQQGQPEVAFFAGDMLYLWPVPDAAYTVNLTYEAIAGDSAATETPDVPVAMLRSLGALVAADLIHEYEIKPAKAQLLMLQAQEAMKTLSALNAERIDSTAVAPAWF